MLVAPRLLAFGLRIISFFWLCCEGSTRASYDFCTGSIRFLCRISVRVREGLYKGPRRVSHSLGPEPVVPELNSRTLTLHPEP